MKLIPREALAKNSFVHLEYWIVTCHFCAACDCLLCNCWVVWTGIYSLFSRFGAIEKALIIQKVGWQPLKSTLNSLSWVSIPLGDKDFLRGSITQLSPFRLWVTWSEWVYTSSQKNHDAQHCRDFVYRRFVLVVFLHRIRQTFYRGSKNFCLNDDRHFYYLLFVIRFFGNKRTTLP